MFYPAATKASLPTGPTEPLIRLSIAVYTALSHRKPPNIHQDALFTSALHLTPASQQTADIATSWLMDPSMWGWAPLHPPPSSWRPVFLRAVSRTHCTLLTVLPPTAPTLQKIANESTITGLINNDEALYREEVKALPAWCNNSHLKVIFDTEDHAALRSYNHWGRSGAGHKL